MRSFHGLDPVSLKAFYFAAEMLHFTKAAEAAALTQSGVSQHIQKLEDELGTVLFERQKKKLWLTESGQRLKKFTETYLDSMDSLFEQIRETDRTLVGKVRYAMPDSCLFTPHFPLLLEARQKRFPQVEIEVRICSSEEVASSVASGEIDFGFVTKPVSERELNTLEFAREEYVLAGASSKAPDISTASSLRDLKFIRYPGMADLFGQWFASEFPKSKRQSLAELNVVSEINTLRGAITMAEKGLGYGVFPVHCIQDLLQAKRLHRYPGPSKRKTTNPIQLITLKSQARTARVEAVIQAFLEMKSKG